MDVNAVSTTGAASLNIVNNTAAGPNSANTVSSANAPEEEETAPNPNENSAAVYERSEKTETKYKPDFDKIQMMMEESERKVAAFQKLIESLLNKQAEKSAAAEAWQGWENAANLKDVVGSLEIDEATRANAQKEIEEGGYYSVEETAKRILDFAVALSGGDPSKIEVLRDATQRGFKEAERIWGGELPEISQKTLDAVMEGFDQWENAGSASAITLLENKK